MEAKSWGLPAPGVASDTWPGLFFASAINSLTELTGNSGFAAKTIGAEVIKEIGAKSFCHSLN